jgi:cytochrome c551/c552
VGPLAERALTATFSLRYPTLSSADFLAMSEALRAARERVLLPRRAKDVARVLGRVGSRFLDSGDPVRREALAVLGPSAVLSPQMALEVLNGIARDWTAERIVDVIVAEFPDPGVLDEFRPHPSGGRVRALGRPLSLHIGAGNVPGVLVTSLIRSLVVKSSAFLKPALGDVVLPVLFLRSLAEEDPELAHCAAVAYWPGGSHEPETAALRDADLVVVYGGDATVASVRQGIGERTPLVAYRHRMSFAVVGREALDQQSAARTARKAARSIALFDQRGCVSPHAFFVEEGGDVSPKEWAQELAGCLRELAQELPASSVGASVASAIHQLKGTAELRAASGEDVMVVGGPNLEWTVVYDPELTLRPSCLGRFVRVSPVRDLEDIPAVVRPLGRVLQTVAVEAAGARKEGLAEALLKIGVSRVASLASMPWPPPWWHHDGAGPLQPLVSWIDLEG